MIDIVCVILIIKNLINLLIDVKPPPVSSVPFQHEQLRIVPRSNSCDEAARKKSLNILDQRINHAKLKKNKPLIRLKRRHSRSHLIRKLNNKNNNNICLSPIPETPSVPPPKPTQDRSLSARITPTDGTFDEICSPSNSIVPNENNKHSSGSAPSISHPNRIFNFNSVSLDSSENNEILYPLVSSMQNVNNNNNNENINNINNINNLLPSNYINININNKRKTNNSDILEPPRKKRRVLINKKTGAIVSESRFDKTELECESSDEVTVMHIDDIISHHDSDSEEKAELLDRPTRVFRQHSPDTTYNNNNNNNNNQIDVGEYIARVDNDRWFFNPQPLRYIPYNSRELSLESSVDINDINNNNNNNDNDTNSDSNSDTNNDNNNNNNNSVKNNNNNNINDTNNDTNNNNNNNNNSNIIYDEIPPSTNTTALRPKLVAKKKFGKDVEGRYVFSNVWRVYMCARWIELLAEKES